MEKLTRIGPRWSHVERMIQIAVRISNHALSWNPSLGCVTCSRADSAHKAHFFNRTSHHAGATLVPHLSNYILFTNFHTWFPPSNQIEKNLLRNPNQWAMAVVSKKHRKKKILMRLITFSFYFPLWMGIDNKL